jgi:hypothetical protein
MVESAIREFAAAEEAIERFLPIACHLNVVDKVFITQGVQGQFGVIGIVFDEENLHFFLGH